MTIGNAGTSPIEPPPILSPVVSCYNEETNIRALYDRIGAVMASCPGGWGRIIYRAFDRISTVPIPDDTRDFWLLSRWVPDVLWQLPERRRFMKGLFAWVGFRTTSVSYRGVPRQSGQTTWSYVHLWRFALDGILSSSDAPRRVASCLGLSVLSFFYALDLVAQTLLFRNPVKSYPSLMVAILFLGGVQLLALEVIP